MTFYNLPGVDAKIDFDSKTKTLQILNLTKDDAIKVSQNNIGEPHSVTVELGKLKGH